MSFALARRVFAQRKDIYLAPIVVAASLMLGKTCIARY